MPACEDCSHFAETHLSNPNNARSRLSGQCRRYPPTVFITTTANGSSANTHQPIVSRSDWCGEFKSNVQATSIFDRPEMFGPPELRTDAETNAAVC
jgi:hypothetical protein